MLFLGGGARATALSGIRINDDSCTRKVGHTCIICGCLALVIGLILIIVGVTSDAKASTYAGIGVISLGAGFFSITLICFYGKLDRCYNNWAYRSHVTPVHIETPQPVPLDVTQKRQSKLLVQHPPPITVISEIDAHKPIDRPVSQVGATTDNCDRVT